MEVDQQKEIDDAASINQLPNEILLMIFRKLQFGELLLATIVSHRWNELAFFLLQNRVLFRIGRCEREDLDGRREWTPNRIYRTVAFRSVYLGSALHPPVEEVRELELDTETVIDESLLDFLKAFRAVETLTVRIVKLVQCKTSHSFQRGTKGLLPSVRHLTLRCRYVRIAGLLAEVAPRLVSLDLELLPRLLVNFSLCRFDCLKALTLRFKVLVYFWSVSRKHDLTSCLRRMRALRKLGLFVNNDESVFNVAFALTSLEELTLGGSFKHLSQAAFRGLSQMTNLRSLIIDVDANGPYFFGKDPHPTVETLMLKGPFYAKLPRLICKFPNLKRLESLTCSQEDSDVQTLVGSPWQNTIEELTIEISSFKPEVVVCFGALQNLRKLCLQLISEPSGLEAVSSIIASVTTLRELRLRRVYGTQWHASAAELADVWGTSGCEIYINEQPVEYFRSFMER